MCVLQEELGKKTKAGGKIGNLKVERKELGVTEGNKTGKVDGIIVG